MTTSDKPLHIDLPVKLEQLKIAFSIASLAFEGDLPAPSFTFNSLRTISASGKHVRRWSPSFIRMPGT